MGEFTTLVIAGTKQVSARGPPVLTPKPIAVNGRGPKTGRISEPTDGVGDGTFCKPVAGVLGSRTGWGMVREPEPPIFSLYSRLR